MHVTTTRRTLVAGLGVCLAVLTLAGSMLAASPTPTEPTSVAAATPARSPAPTLTMGPLVTLPPIGVPSVLNPAALADGYALGLATAPVTVDVWEDFQCPYCLRYTELVEPQLVGSYVAAGKVRYVFHHLAFLGEESRWAAVAARLAEEQGKFWPFHDFLYANQQGENVGSFTLDRLQAVAAAVGLDMATFDAGLQMDAARASWAQIEQQARADATALGIKATPTVLVNGTAVASPDFATIQAAIEAALATAATPGATSATASPASPITPSVAP